MTQLWQKRGRILQVVVGLGTAALLILLARTLPAVTFRAGLGVPAIEKVEVASPNIPGITDEMWRIFLILMWSSFFIALLYLLLSREGRSRLRRVFGGLAVQILYVLLVASITLFFISLSDSAEPPEEEGEARPGIEIDLPGAPLAEAPEETYLEVQPPAWLTLLLTTLFMALVGYGAYRWWLYRRDRPDAQPVSFAELSRRAELAIAELRQGQQLDDVILRCYREMAEAVSAQRGLQRGLGVTPREYEKTLLRAGLPHQAVERLTRLFELVRYGGYQPGKRDQLEAIDSLTVIVAACNAYADQAQAAALRSQHDIVTAVAPRRRWLP